MKKDKNTSETLTLENDGEKTIKNKQEKQKKPFFESILSFFKMDKAKQSGNSEAIPAPHKLKKVKNARVGWIFQMFYKPRATMKKVADEKESIRRLPLIFITIIVILAVLISAPVKKMQIEQGATIPENFQYWSEDQQNQYYESQQNQTDPIFLYGFPFGRNRRISDCVHVDVEHSLPDPYTLGQPKSENTDWKRGCLGNGSLWIEGICQIPQRWH